VRLRRQLAIVTVCDHCTRVKVGGSRQDPASRILGLLLGFQEGLDVSITDAVEMQVRGILKLKLKLGLKLGGGLIPRPTRGEGGR
jgi:hypothetical protein